MVKEYTKRVIICMVGLALCGLGSALGVRAGDVGTNAWNTLALGLQRLTQQSFGTCTFLVSLSIVVIDLLGRGKLGFGSLLNVIFVAYFSDFWLTHLDFFPVEVNTADYETLLRVPGVGVISARRILAARRNGRLHVDDLKKLGVVMKRAQYFLTASGRMPDGLRFTPDSLLRNLIALEQPQLPQQEMVQLSLFDSVCV